MPPKAPQLTTARVSVVLALFAWLLLAAGGSGASPRSDASANPPPPPQAARAYTITRLPPLAGTSSRAHALNESGLVVGRSSINVTNNPEQAVLWDTTVNPIAITPLGVLPGAGATAGSDAYDINENGFQVVGWSANAGTNIRAVLWTRFPLGIRNLGTLPGGNHSMARSIADSGEIVGESTNAQLVRKAFTWSPPGPMERLWGGAGSGAGVAHSISTFGDTSVGLLGDQAVSERSVSLALTGGLPSIANGVDKSGTHVVGRFTTFSRGSHAALWTPLSMLFPNLTDLGALGGNSSEAEAVNEQQIAVGRSRVVGGGEHAFVWDRVNGMQDLNDLVADPSWELIEASDIANNGAIVGRGRLNGHMNGFLLRPVRPQAGMGTGRPARSGQLRFRLRARDGATLGVSVDVQANDGPQQVAEKVRDAVNTEGEGNWQADQTGCCGVTFSHKEDPWWEPVPELKELFDSTGQEIKISAGIGRHTVFELELFGTATGLTEEGARSVVCVSIPDWPCDWVRDGIWPEAGDPAAEIVDQVFEEMRYSYGDEAVTRTSPTSFEVEWDNDDGAVGADLSTISTDTGIVVDGSRACGYEERDEC